MENKWVLDRYLEFASKIHFYDFKESEYGKSLLVFKDYSDALEGIVQHGTWSLDELADFIQVRPESWKVFEALLREQSFSRAQMIYFIFNTEILNSPDVRQINRYLLYNLNNDKNFELAFKKSLSSNDMFNEINETRFDAKNLDKSIGSTREAVLLATAFKMCADKYAEDNRKNDSSFRSRLSNKNFRDNAMRLARYLIENLDLNNAILSIRLEQYFDWKRKPADIKGLHGKFGANKVRMIIEKHGVRCANSVLSARQKVILPQSLSALPSSFDQVAPFYFRECFLEGVNKSETGKPKKFDFVICLNARPRILIETNFYSTTGTKIGINEGEYAALKRDLKKKSNLRFVWITDGNYWLTPNGMSRYINLYNTFADDLLNYNLLDMNLPQILRSLK